jgi:ribosomal protein S18 acetylase RimI-like enzyme
MLPSYFNNLRIVEKYVDVNAEIIQFFEDNDRDFYPPISQRTELTSFIELTFIHLGFIIVYEQEGKIIGLVAVCFENPRYQYYLRYIAVSQSNRGLGIGHQLIQAASYFVHKSGGTQLILTSWSSNVKAKNFYNKIGFVIIDILEDDRSPGVHTYIFALDLLKGLITRPVAGIDLITEDHPQILEKVQRIFLDIDKEKSVLEPFIKSAEQMQAIPENFIKHRFLQPSTFQVFTHTLNLTYAYPTFELTHDTSIEYINILDYCTRSLAKVTKKYLVLHQSKEIKSHGIHYPHAVYLNQTDELILQEVIQRIIDGQNASDYASDFLLLSDKYACDGLILADNALSGMFRYRKMIEGKVVIDPLRDFAIHVGSQRLKSQFSVNQIDYINH